MSMRVVSNTMVAGFLFTPTHVLLVRKTKPAWQMGLLNGVGGKIEPKEMPIDAMRREFKEETRIPDILEWSLFATEYELAQQALVYFYAARCAQPLGVPRVNDSGERLEWTLTSSLHYNKDKIGNLSWLIPLALDPRRLLKVEVVARDDITEIKTW